MLEETELTTLLAHLTEMTDVSNTPHTQKSARALERTLPWAAVVFLIAILIAFTVHHEAPKWRPDILTLTVLAISAGFFAINLIYLILMLLPIIQAARISNRTPSYVTRERLRERLLGDAKFLRTLSSFAKSDIEYALIQYRNQWLAFSNGIELFVGKLSALGLIPGMLSIAVSVEELFRKEPNELLAILFGFFGSIYYFALFGLALTERPQQVMKLLQFSINHHNDAPPSNRAPARAISDGN